MDSFLDRYKNALVLIVLLLAQIIALAIQIRRPIETGAADGAKVTLARSWVVALVTPVERLFLSTGHGLRSTWSNYIDLRHLRQHDRDLQVQIDQLRLQQAAIAEDAVQGHRLQALLAFQQHYIAATVAAQVIGTSGTDLSRVLYIDKGAADGLKPDMPVITPDGIVGKIRDVFPQTAPHTAQVLLINDQTSGAGVILASTRVRAIIHGTSGGRVQISNLTPDDRIKPGEPVLTSGGDQVFPRGLPVGTIEAVAPDPDHQPYTAILVKPAVNLFQLEEVLIITGTQPSLPPETLHALAKGAQVSVAMRVAAEKAAAAKAAADEKEAAARSAAETVADRLPSLRDVAATPGSPEAKAQAAADAANPKAAGGHVPRPLPTLHADRYSPGTTPSASSLIPGAPRPAAPPQTTPETTPQTAPSTDPTDTLIPQPAKRKSSTPTATDPAATPRTAPAPKPRPKAPIQPHPTKALQPELPSTLPPQP